MRGVKKKSKSKKNQKGEQERDRGAQEEETRGKIQKVIRKKPTDSW